MQTQSFPDTIRELIKNAKAENADPIDWVLDYLQGRNAHPTRREAERLVEKYRETQC